MANVSFGIFDHIERTSTAGSPYELYDERLKLAEAADRAGFYCYHLAEHHATPLGMAPAPNIVLAAMAARTRQLRLSALVYLLPLYIPLRLIEELCMLDQLSGGRLDIGVGRGISPYELQFFRLPFWDSREMFEEALEVLVAGLRSERLTHRGEYYRYKNVPMEQRPRQTPNPPFWYAASTDDATRFAAARAMHMVNRGPTARVRRWVEMYREIRAGGDTGAANLNPNAPAPILGASRQVFVAESDRAAMEAARPAYRAHHANLQKLWRDFRTEVMGFTDNLEPACQDGSAVVGSPAAVADSIARFSEETGCGYFVASFAWGDLKPAQYMKSFELFAEKVMPQLSRR